MRWVVPVKSRPVRGRKFLTLWWASFTMTRRIRDQLGTAHGQADRNASKLNSESQVPKLDIHENNKGCTCRSWGRSALLSVCQKGRRHHRLPHPLRRFHLSHTERCCLTAAGKAEREEIMMEEKNRIKKAGRVRENAWRPWTDIISRFHRV